MAEDGDGTEGWNTRRQGAGMMADSLHLQACMQAEIDGLRAQLVTLTRERDEAVAREAVMREALSSITRICASRTHETDDPYEGQVNAAYDAAAAALANPSSRVTALMRVVEAAQKYCDESMDNENVNDSFDDLYDACAALRAYQEGSNG